MDRGDVQRWVAGYERLWRRPGTDRLAELFTTDVSYLPSPWAPPVEGVDALGRFWEAERDGPGEAFTMVSEVVAVDAGVAVVRVTVEYGSPVVSAWRDLWVLGFAADGRCSTFEEWPFSPDRPDGHDPT